MNRRDLSFLNTALPPISPHVRYIPFPAAPPHPARHLGLRLSGPVVVARLDLHPDTKAYLLAVYTGHVDDQDSLLPCHLQFPRT